MPDNFALAIAAMRSLFSKSPHLMLTAVLDSMLEQSAWLADQTLAGVLCGNSIRRGRS